MRNTLIRGLSAVIFLLALVGCQQLESATLTPTAYESEQDVYIVFHGQHFDGVTRLLPAAVVSEVALALQEGTHENITDLTGAEIDHYYIWVCLERACIPVDPFSYSW